MKKYFILLVFLFSSFALCTAQQELRLWYDHPAKNWLESVPLGNGRLGAMPDGGIFNERIILNDITLWSGGPQNANKKGALAYLPKIRELIFEGQNAKAEALVNKYFVCEGEGSGHGNGANVPYGSYQILGNLHLTYNYGKDSDKSVCENYFRSLSLDSALATTSFTLDGVHYKREYFTSFSDDVVIIRM